MKQYKRKPEIVEAVQYLEDGSNCSKICDWLSIDHESTYRCGQLPIHYYQGSSITAIEPGDWVVLNPDGSVVKCDAGEFAEAYEEV